MKKLFLCYIFSIIFLLISFPAFAEQDILLEIPKAEGSKSFDFEINQINNRGIQLYQQGDYKNAIVLFEKALGLAQQLRDPSRGILHYNLALSLHESGQHEEATKQFYSARRFARGNFKIMESELLKIHDCGLNPSVACKYNIPLEMNIEGSD